MEAVLLPEYNKNVVELNISSANLNDADACNFYVDILDSIRNVVYIKISKVCIVIKPNSKVGGNFKYNDGDSIYIGLNDYDRVSAVINGSIGRFFESVDVNLTQVYTILGDRSDATKTVLYTKEYSAIFDKNDVSVYKLKPVDPNLKRFNMQLFDKNGQYLLKSDVVSFKILLCVYSTNKNF